MSKYLVTGGAGYIGSRMVAMLVAAGHDVYVVDDLSTGHRDTVHPDATFLRRDIRSALGLYEVFDALGGQFAGVFHFAGRSIVAESSQDPLSYYDNNVCGTLNLLACMRDSGVRNIVFSSSAAATVPHSPYGRSKSFVEDILRDCDTAYGIKSAALRYFNAAGAAPDGSSGERHDPETHLIPNAVRAALHGTPLTIYGNLSNVRDYVHVDDLCYAHLAAMHYLHTERTSLTLDLGRGEGASVEQVVDRVAALTGRDIILRFADARVGDPSSLVADNRLSRKLLGWEPRYSLDDIINHAIAWHSKETA